MKKFVMMLSIVVLSVNFVSGAVVTTDNFISADEQSQFTIDFVTISGDTNPAGGQGNVTGDYRMGMFEITNEQYANFASNSNIYWTGDNVPANRISWIEAAQFVNYLNTSTGHQAAYKFTADVIGVWQTGEDGYDISNPIRNSNAKYFLPTEDEWIKAAYWNGSTLQSYAAKTGQSLTQGDGASGTGWNYYDARYATDPYGPWDVGSGSEELNGTYDMMGNVWERTETDYCADVSDGSDPIIRGGSCFNHDGYLTLANGYRTDIDGEGYDVGFRVASVVPEPCTLMLLLGGSLILRKRMR